MNPPLQSTPPFPYALSFVVKLHHEADVQHGLLRGRVEHLATGLRREFGDAAGLNEGFADLLRCAQAAPDLV